MKRLLLYFAFLFMLWHCEAQEKPNTFKVMSWNILHGANDIKDGRINAIKIIKEINPDVILMVETYGSGKMIADSLGYYFHLIAPDGTALDNKNVNLSIISKYPFGKRIDTKYPSYLGGREILIHNQKIRFFTNWFHYLPWENEPEKISGSVEDILKWEKKGYRSQMIDSIMPYMNHYANETDSIPLIFGGDLNSPSHLDWTTQTKHLHANKVISWHATKVLERIGLIDSYRTLNPNPIANPGITWDSKGVRDEHRIDYIFYKGPKIRATNSETYMVYFNDPIFINGNKIVYPSDHGFVVTTFEIQ